MKILVTGNLSLHQDFLKNFSIDIIETDNHHYIIKLPEDVQIKKNIVTANHLPKFTSEELLSEYISSHDNSLKDFITYKSTIIASGNIEEVDEELGLPYDYVVEGDFRIYNQMNTFDFNASSQIDVQEYYHYLERMLVNSTRISSNNNPKKK